MFQVQPAVETSLQLRASHGRLDGDAEDTTLRGPFRVFIEIDRVRHIGEWFQDHEELVWCAPRPLRADLEVHHLLRDALGEAQDSVCFHEVIAANSCQCLRPPSARHATDTARTTNDGGEDALLFGASLRRDHRHGGFQPREVARAIDGCAHLGFGDAAPDTGSHVLARALHFGEAKVEILGQAIVGQGTHDTHHAFHISDVHVEDSG
mmetsp:Transcript_15484/g.33558  ORF Transcript_15484/g.33558 Transcript_15484/m.33558 type:complete len:208 (+) Transcript_15484:1193-1816(+)